MVFSCLPPQDSIGRVGFSIYMEKKQICSFNLSQLKNQGTFVYSLDSAIKSLCDEALQAGHAGGLQFAKTVLDLASDLELKSARERCATSIMLFNNLTDEQLAVLHQNGAM